MNNELILIGVASDGSVEQWDGLNTPQGILLRWFHGALGFPEFGYDVFRANTTAYTELNWSYLSDGINNRQMFKQPDGLTLTCLQGFQFGSYQGSHALKITLSNPVTFVFPDPAWYLSVQMAPNQGDEIAVKLFAGGKVRETRLLNAGSSQGIWRTRGIDRVELSGEGLCTGFSYQLISSIAGWKLIHHTCLPVTNPAYAGGPCWSGTDEDEAHRRLPANADWDARYRPAFKELYPYLQSLAAGKPLPPLLPSTQTGQETPSLNLNTMEAIETAMLNPHLARMLGTAWDDPLGGYLDGIFYAYKVVGTWQGALHQWLFRSQAVLEVLAGNGIKIEVQTEQKPVRNGWNISLPDNSSMDITVERPCAYLTLTIAVSRDLYWQTADINGQILEKGLLQASKRAAGLRVCGDKLHQIQLLGPSEFRLTQIKLQDAPIERTAFVPPIVAGEPGPPAGPKDLYCDIMPAGNAARSLEGHLYWDVLANPSGAVREVGPAFYQVAGLQAGDEPDEPAPQIPGFDRRYLLMGDDLLIIPPQVLASDNPCFFIDRPLSEGWRCWWVRGVDLFGRVSGPSWPVLTQICDNAPPPAPSLLLAEYVQDGLTAGQQNLAGYSAFGYAWLEANPGGQAVVAGWGWSPELAADWPDVDGFEVYVRRPRLVQSQNPGEPAAAYADDLQSWGPARAELGPVETAMTGLVWDVFEGIPEVTLTLEEAADTAHTVYRTDISLDIGRGALLGSRIKAADGTILGTIIGHGEGPSIRITVEHPENQPIISGTYALGLEYGSGQENRMIFTVDTGIKTDAMDSDPFCRRISGVLENTRQRWAVLSHKSGRFLCIGEDKPAAGESITWFPSYLIAIPDKDFGPDPIGTGLPVAYAQVAVRSVRRWKKQHLVSEFSRPGTLSAVNCTQPTSPVLDPLPCGPFCAQLATRADWYGISRFTLRWETRPGETYKVYRAMNEAVFALDRKAYGEGAEAKTHPFPDDPGQVWPAGIYYEIIADTNRKKIVQNDFSQLDAALAAGEDSVIRSAYRKLHADTQRLLAGQSCVESAYSLRHGHPLAPEQVPFTDEFDGRSVVHWFYRVTTLSVSGVESAKTEPTPPICCPDTVPPAPPSGHLALGGEGTVKLQWLPSSAADLAFYLIYRAGSEAAAADIRTMTQVAKLAKDPSVSASTGVKSPSWVTKPDGSMAVPKRLEYCDPAAPGSDWFYRIVAEDSSGNRSLPSAILRGRALAVPPAPPVWNPPVLIAGTNPQKVLLSWTHPTDQRLACLVERRVAGGSLWTGISGWLPRSVYTYQDTPPDMSLAWEYRLRVRDHLGQASNVMPVVSISALP